MCQIKSHARQAVARRHAIEFGCYVVSAMLSLYFNVFVGVVQAFQKLPLLQPLAPTGTEPPFAVAQGLVLIAFIVLTVLTLKRFYPARGAAAVSMKIS